MSEHSKEPDRSSQGRRRTDLDITRFRILDPEPYAVFKGHWPDKIKRGTMVTTSGAHTVFIHNSDYMGRIRVVLKRGDGVVETCWQYIVSAMLAAEPGGEFGLVTAFPETSPVDEVKVEVSLNDLKWFVAGRVLAEQVRALEEMEVDQLLEFSRERVERWARTPTLLKCGECGCPDRSICGCP